MDTIDRSVIPALHAAARRQRAAHLARLLADLRRWWREPRPARQSARTVPCG